jgi:hypothetical protein
MELATNDGADAMPEGFVATTRVLPPLENVPLGPVEGAVNVTETPLTAFPDESDTIACRGDGYCLDIDVLCGEPAAVAMRAAVPTVIVRE